MEKPLEKLIFSSKSSLLEAMVKLATIGCWSVQGKRCIAYIPGHHGGHCTLLAGHEGECDGTPISLEGNLKKMLGPIAEEISLEVQGLNAAKVELTMALKQALETAQAAEAREIQCLKDLEAIGDALGWKAGDYVHKSLPGAVTELRSDLQREHIRAEREMLRHRALLARLDLTTECLEGCEACAASPESAPHYSLREMHARAELAEARMRENVLGAPYNELLARAEGAEAELSVSKGFCLSLEKERDEVFTREGACMADLEAIGTALGWRAGEYTYPGLAAGVADLRARAERAEAGLAALREAWANVLHSSPKDIWGQHGWEQRSMWALRDAFANVATAAEASSESLRRELRDAETALGSLREAFGEAHVLLNNATTLAQAEGDRRMAAEADLLEIRNGLRKMMKMEPLPK